MKVQYSLVVLDFPSDLKDKVARTQFLHLMEHYWKFTDIGSLDDDYYAVITGKVDPLPSFSPQTLISTIQAPTRCIIRRTEVTETGYTDIYFSATLHVPACKRNTLTTSAHLRRLYDEEEVLVAIEMDTRIQITSGPWAHHSTPMSGESRAVQSARLKIEEDFNTNVVPFLIA